MVAVASRLPNHHIFSTNKPTIPGTNTLQQLKQSIQDNYS
jgi:hypothetical protein